MNCRILIGIFLFFSISLSSQESLNTVIAKKGDGIFTILRSEGIIGDKYYLEFVELNQDKIKNGTVLQVGKTYQIPNAPDSFKNMGRKIQLPEDIEVPIFTTDIKTLKKKSKALVNTVYYLVFDKFDAENLDLLKEVSTQKEAIAKAMAKELMQQGARVFLFAYDKHKNQKLGDYVDAINKRHVKYTGQHQRLLYVNIDQEIIGDEMVVSISHYEKSKEGKQLAKSIENMFVSENIKLNSSKKHTAFFTDKANLYLAKNAIPTMTCISVAKKTAITSDKVIEVSDADFFVDKITTGIRNDYSSLSFEE